MPTQYSATATAPVNIATIKYWGKRDEKLILPLNDSISVTLSTDHMCAKTTVAISPNFKEDRIWLNGKEESILNPRLQNCLRNIKQLSKIPSEQLNWKTHICSVNNFPTAAGLASSSAGYACLVFALSKIYKVDSDVSNIARQGSGSACRSMYGGFVRWHMGTRDNGLDSVAAQIAPALHWLELRIIILVVNDQQKKISSTVAMQRTAQTSQLLKHRIDKCVKIHTEKMMKAIQNKDFNLFAEITMRESNQFHATCLDTYPPAVFMSDTSHAIASFVHLYNTACNNYKIAYTYDAGPNACLFLLEQDVPKVLIAINKSFPTTVPATDYFKGIQVDLSKETDIPDIDLTMDWDVLKFIICTKVGNGPSLLPSDDSLLDGNGIPNTNY